MHRAGLAEWGIATRRVERPFELNRLTGTAVYRVNQRRMSAGFLTDVFLELTTELSIKSLGKWVVSKKSDRSVHPCLRPRAGEIARASQQLRRNRRRRRVKYFRLVSI